MKPLKRPKQFVIIIAGSALVDEFEDFHRVYRVKVGFENLPKEDFQLWLIFLGTVVMDKLEPVGNDPGPGFERDDVVRHQREKPTVWYFIILWSFLPAQGFFYLIKRWPSVVFVNLLRRKSTDEDIVMNTDGHVDPVTDELKTAIYPIIRIYFNRKPMNYAVWNILLVILSILNHIIPREFD